MLLTLVIFSCDNYVEPHVNIELQALSDKDAIIVHTVAPGDNTLIDSIQLKANQLFIYTHKSIYLDRSSMKFYNIQNGNISAKIFVDGKEERTTESNQEVFKLEYYLYDPTILHR